MDNLWLVLLTFAICVSSSILSGMSGGGAGFIIVPYYIFIGLTPQQAIATSKMGAIGTTVGALTAFKGKGLVNKKLIWPFVAITTIAALFAAWVIPQIDETLFQKVIGVFLLLLVPTLFINRAAFQPGERSSGWVIAGFVAYTVFSFLQTIIGTGMGTILVLILMFLFGLTALEANATKRVAQSVQAVILFVLLFLQGLVVLAHGAAAILGGLIGAHIGSRVALKKGNKLVKIALAFVMASSGVVLLLF